VSGTRALFAGGLALAALAACEPELTLEAALQGKPCRAQAPRCLPDFECNASNVCVRSASLGGAGGGDGVVSNPGGSGGGSSGSTSTGGTGPGVVAVAQGGSTGGSGLVDAPSDAGSDVVAADAAVASDGGCIPGPLYQDLDGDGFGGELTQAFGCSGNGLVTVPGDCFDADPTFPSLAAQVYPGQTEPFFVGYPDMNKPDGISFDYDCSGSEERDENNALGIAPVCSSLGGAECEGTGYEPYPQRVGNDTDSICGSEIIVTCTTSGPEPCNEQRDPTNDVFRCR
jgi:hypothetical protein